MSNKGLFKVKNIVDLESAKIGDTIPESDAIHFNKGKAIQYTYVRPDELDIEKIPLKPGIFAIDYVGQALTFIPTSYTKDSILKDYSYTKQIMQTAEFFFKNIDIYLKLGDEVPKRGCLLYGPPGCHAKGTEILMFDGSIKKVEDVVVGDTLMGPDSKSRIVLQLAHNRQRMVNIIPTKGESFVVNEDHILHLTPSGEAPTRSPINIRFSDYVKETKCFQNRFKLTRTGVEFNEKSLIIPPYILGLWLGDGHSHSQTLTTMDKEIKDEWIEYGRTLGLSCNEFRKTSSKARAYFLSSGPSRPGHQKEGRNPFLNYLKDLNLINNKHIPQQYLTGSRTQRLELLAGLIDTDGTVGMFKTHCSITFKSNELAKGTVFLARSLGFAVYSKKRVSSCQTGASDIYNFISISGDLSIIPSRLERKTCPARKQIKSVLRTGFKYEYLPEDEYFGFSLSGDHLYLTSDFTIHHNTSKSTSIKELANEYVSDGNTAVVIWPTDRIESHTVKSFLKQVDYKVNRMIFVIEDIGGVEVGESSMGSDSSLLSILDNQEKLFKIPTYIIATTNFPEAFMENLTNRPGRFDDQIEVTYPPVEQRIKLLEFFAETLVQKAQLQHLLTLTEEDKIYLTDNKFEKFTASHIRELVIRTLTHGLTLKSCADQMLANQKLAQKRYSKTSTLGGW